jgi:muconate cycloisomerase
MTHIDAVRIHTLSIPMRKEFRISKASMIHQDLVIVEVETDTGTGLGEAQFVPGFFSCQETSETASVVLSGILGPHIVGRDPLEFRTLAFEIDRAFPGHSYAKAALVDAVVDAAARTQDAPLYRLFGGMPRDLALGWPIGMSSVEQTVAEARWALDIGFSEVKIKIGGRSSREDLEVVRAVRDEVDQVIVRVDGNAGLELEDAVWLLPRLSELGVQLIEEPLRDPMTWKWKRVRTLVPDILMADESVTCTREALELWRAGCIDAVAIKLAKMGGAVATADLVVSLQRLGIRVFGASQPASSVGVANMAHLMSGLGAFSFAGEFHAGSHLLAGDIVTEPIVPDRGRIRVNETCVGNGMTLENAALREFSIVPAREIDRRVTV